MIKAILYTSQTGTTEWYAKRLEEELKLPVLQLKEGEKELGQGTEIIYLGSIRADMVSGLDKAQKLFKPKLVVAVGMTRSGERIEEVRKANNIDQAFPLFTLQGGYYPRRLHGISKLILSLVVKSQIKSLKEKENRTKEDDEMLSMLQNGGEKRDEEGIKKVLTKLKEMREVK